MTDISSSKDFNAEEIKTGITTAKEMIKGSGAIDEKWNKLIDLGDKFANIILTAMQQKQKPGNNNGHSEELINIPMNNNSQEQNQKQKQVNINYRFNDAFNDLRKLLESQTLIKPETTFKELLEDEMIWKMINSPLGYGFTSDFLKKYTEVTIL